MKRLFQKTLSFGALVAFPFLAMMPAYSEGAIEVYRCSGIEQEAGRVEFNYTIERLTGSALYFNYVEHSGVGSVGLKAEVELAVNANGWVSIDGTPVGRECNTAEGEFSALGKGKYALHFQFACGAQDHVDIRATCKNVQP